MQRQLKREIHVRHRGIFLFHRSFVDAKVKWVRDPYLDATVEREKNLTAALSLKNLILSSSSNSIPLSIAFSHNSKIIHRYPTLFKIFIPSPTLSPPHVKLTRQLLSIHRDEASVHDSFEERDSASRRLIKLLMLARARTLPLNLIDGLKFDLGLPDNFLLDLVSFYPDSFRVCRMSEIGSFGVELVNWREDLAVSAVQTDAAATANLERIRFQMSFPRGFDLQKKVKDWTEMWESLPYISPYEDAFHLAPSSDQMEKWAVAVLHELLSISVSKKTEIKNIFGLGDYLGFGPRFKKAIVHFPGIFYVSNKIRTQTVVLREAYKKDFLMTKHPLMGMRYRYIYLMSKSEKLRKQIKKGTAEGRCGHKRKGSRVGCVP